MIITTDSDKSTEASESVVEIKENVNYQFLVCFFEEKQLLNG